MVTEPELYCSTRASWDGSVCVVDFNQEIIVCVAHRAVERLMSGWLLGWRPEFTEEISGVDIGELVFTGVKLEFTIG